MAIKWMAWGAALLLAMPQIVFRFNHPEMTETELFLNFFEAYRELVK